MELAEVDPLTYLVKTSCLPLTILVTLLFIVCPLGVPCLHDFFSIALNINQYII